MRLEHWLYTIPLRLRSLFRRREVEQELEDELQYHLAMRIEEYTAKGVSPEEARRAALREMGGLAQRQEECRDARRVRYLEDALQDLRYAVRTLHKSPTMAAVVVLSLALGIGANTAIFSVMDAVMLKMLPVQKPQQLMLLTAYAKAWPEKVVEDLEGNGGKDKRTGLMMLGSLSSATFDYIRRNNDVFASTLAFASNDDRVNLGLNGRASDGVNQAVSGNYFEVLGVSAIAGRALQPADDNPGAPPVAVVSYGFWQRSLGGDASACGKAITVNGVPVTIVGVAPREFFGMQPGRSPDLYVTLAFQVEQLRRGHNFDVAPSKVWWLTVAGRLQPGVSETQAASELKVLFERSLDIGSVAVPRDVNTPWLELSPAGRGLDDLREEFSTSLFLLTGMVGLVLLIACANVAGLLLARATARRREFAVRLSLGAPRWRIIRQLLTESVLLGLMGGAAGLLVARWMNAVLVPIFANAPFQQITIAVHPNARVLAFTAAVSILSGTLFGLAPALRSTRVEVFPALKSGPGSNAGSRFRSGKVLVGAQIALCLLLLVSAGLLVRTLRRLQNVDVGFDRQNLVQFQVQPGLNGYKGERLAGYYQELQRRIGAIGGVSSVGLSLQPPIGAGYSQGRLSIPGITTTGQTLPFFRHWISPGFFETLRMPLVAGRVIGAQDVKTSRRVIVINQRLVRDYFHNQNPIGREVNVGGGKELAEVIGVVGDAKYGRLRDDAPPTVYLSYLQYPKDYLSFMTFEVRSAGDPKTIIGAIEREALALDKDVPLIKVTTESEIIDNALFLERAFALLSSSFGVLALGAQRETILTMVLRETLRIVVAGLLVGVPLAWMGTRLLEHQLFGLSAHDPGTILLAIAAIVAVTIVAGFLPARRASRVDPMVALRFE